MNKKRHKKEAEHTEYTEHTEKEHKKHTESKRPNIPINNSVENEHTE